jgi:hypothetical protein
MKIATATALAVLLYAEATLARRRPLAPFNQVVKKYDTAESTWAGAMLQAPGLTYASATANVPAAGGGSSAGGSAWVGIEGAACNSLLQTGFSWFGDGTYEGWYEWYPDGSRKCSCPRMS